MAFKILSPTPEALRFVDEWADSSGYVVAHTSGSTGEPKLIRLSKRMMSLSARATCARFGLNSSSMLLLPLSASYIAGKMMIVRAMEANCPILTLPPSLTPEIPADRRFDLMALVPPQLEALINGGLCDSLLSCRAIIVGGAPVSQRLESLCSSLGLNVYATYGMTETASHVALRPLGSPGPFEAMPGIRFATDSDSCLIIKGELFPSDIVTHDVVTLHSQTTFTWRGRRDNIINSGGLKIQPEHLERQLAPAMRGIPFYIVGVDDNRWGQKAVMYAETNPDTPFWPVIVSRLATLAPRKMLPKEIRCVSRFDHTDSGKIKRSTNLPITKILHI